MKFGVIVRSIGERTERLCFESISRYVGSDQIFILRNNYPSFKAYQKMFKIAKKQQFDWFLGIDADVVLKDDWYSLFMEKIDNGKCDSFFRVQFYTFDGITESKLVRGNNFYNGKYLSLSEKYLNKNINIGRFWFYFKKKGLSTGYFTKPETSIRTHFKEKLGIFDKIFCEVIGYHAYEQYYCEIFRQYMTRRKRDPGFATRPGNEFLHINYQERLFHNNQLDKFVANVAWNSDFFRSLKHIDGRVNQLLEDYLFTQYGLEEKQDLDINLKPFINILESSIGDG